MEYKFYNSWMYQNEVTELSEASLVSKKVFFRFYFEPILNCNVGQRCLRGEYNDVYYMTNKLEEILQYHSKRFNDIDTFQLVETAFNLSVISKKYIAETFIGSFICNCNYDFSLKTIARYNEKFELLEYREAIYNPDKTLQKEKIFIPSLWKTFEEDY